MTHTYHISGMTCAGCQLKVQSRLSAVPGVLGVAVDLDKGQATVTMQKHVATENLRAALKDYPKYNLSEVHDFIPPLEEVMEVPTSWLQTYKPILLIFGYSTAIALIAGFNDANFKWMEAMRVFMAGFFLSFSFFKMLDLNGFADSYATYDIIAKKIRAWGFIYAFIELALGLAYASNFNPLFTSIVTLAVMTVSIAGVLQAVLNKRRIRCACLGAVFNLPMSTVTIIEDALMIVMSAIMIIQLM